MAFVPGLEITRATSDTDKHRRVGPFLRPDLKDALIVVALVDDPEVADADAIERLEARYLRAPVWARLTLESVNGPASQVRAWY